MSRVLQSIENKNTKSYGLKISSPFDIVSIEKKVIGNAYGDIVIAEPGVYEVHCTSDTYVHHNIVPGLMHITCISRADDIIINIKASGTLTGDNVSDIYHSIVAANTGVKSKIDSRGVAYDNSKIIYRSSLGANSLSEGVGSQSGKFLLLSDTAEIDAEPSLDIYSDKFPTSHAIGVSGVDQNKTWYLATHGYDKLSGESEIVEGFLNI